jgi:hypothetical protein
MIQLTAAHPLRSNSWVPPPLDTLTREQEAELVSDDKLLLVAVCSLNHWSLDQLLEVYQIPKLDAVKRLRILDRMGIIELLPGDRIRRRAKRDFDWIPDGPIRAFFAKQGLNDFLEGPFDPEDESLDFANGMLTRAAQLELKLELRRLCSKLVVLHEQSIAAPLADKDGIGLLLAIRQWEPPAFRRMRREVARASGPSVGKNRPPTAIGIGLPPKPSKTSNHF